MPLLLTVEFLGGETLDEAVADALALANRLHCGIQFRWNTHHAWVRPGQVAADQVTFLEATWDALDASEARDIPVEPDQAGTPRMGASDPQQGA